MEARQQRTSHKTPEEAAEQDAPRGQEIYNGVSPAELGRMAPRGARTPRKRGCGSRRQRGAWPTCGPGRLMGP